MRFIPKKTETPFDFQAWLDANAQAIQAKYVQYEANLTSSKKVKSDIAWNLLPSSAEDAVYSKAILRKTLLMEQGYLCAYCGSYINDNPHVRLDHVCPKSLKINDSFNYQNIVAACSGGKYIWHTIRQGETLESIAAKYATDSDSIQRLNPTTDFKPNTLFEVHVGTDKKILLQLPVNEPHCDVKKSDNPHPIKPTDADCALKFNYDYDGKIGAVDKYQQEAAKTIDVLGLNDNIFLLEKRRNICHKIDGFVKAILKSNPTQLKTMLLQKKNTLYHNPEKLSEMVFVEEFFLNSLLSKK